MGKSSKICRVWLGLRTGSDKNTPLTTTEVENLDLYELPLSTGVADLNITSGEPLTADNIGGKLLNQWTQSGFSGADGKLTIIPDANFIAGNDDLIQDAFGEKANCNANADRNITVASVAAGSSEFTTMDNDILDTAPVGSYYVLREGSNSYPCRLQSVTVGGAGTFKVVGGSLPAMSDVLTHPYQFDVSKRDIVWYAVVCMFSDGSYALLDWAVPTLQLDLRNPGVINLADLKILCLYVHPEGNQSAYQTAIATAVSAAGDCPRLSAAPVNVYSYVAFVTKDFVTEMELTNNGLVNANYTHDRNPETIMGSGGFNNKVDIIDTENTVSVTLQVYDRTTIDALKLREGKKTDEVLIITNTDARFGVILTDAYVTSSKDGVDSNGLQVTEFTVTANQQCDGKCLVSL